jgi:hypothetical protein
VLHDRPFSVTQPARKVEEAGWNPVALANQFKVHHLSANLRVA